MTVSHAAAFFDLDRTLMSGASAFPFAVEAWRAGLVPTRQILQDGINALVFRLLGASDARSEEVRTRFLSGVAGVEVSELDAVARAVLPKLVGKVRAEAGSLLRMHQEAGRDTWIVSASHQPIVAPLSLALNMTGAIGTRGEVVDGRYTDRLEGPFVYGQGKADAIATLAAARGYDLTRSYAYSDSVSDLPMLELVGHPVAVNPDGPLDELAHERGWPIVIFARRAKRVIALTTAGFGAGATAFGTYLLGRRHGRIAAEAARGRFAFLKS